METTIIFAASMCAMLIYEALTKNKKNKKK